jgi:hypothetical protein
MLSSIIKLRKAIRNISGLKTELDNYYLSTEDFNILANIVNILGKYFIIYIINNTKL